MEGEPTEVPTFQDLLLRGAVGQILERAEWWLAWDQDRKRLVRDAGLWFVAQKIRHTLSLRPVIDQVLQDEIHVWLSQVSCEMYDSVKREIQDKILRALAPTIAPMKISSDSYNELASYFATQSLRDKSRTMEDARSISWPIVRALYKSVQSTATQRFIAFISALNKERVKAQFRTCFRLRRASERSRRLQF